MNKMEWHSRIKSDWEKKKSDWEKYFRWTYVCSPSLRLDIFKILQYTNNMSQHLLGLVNHNKKKNPVLFYW